MPDSEIVRSNADLLIADMEPVTAALTRASDAARSLSRTAEQIGGELAEIERQLATFAPQPTQSVLDLGTPDPDAWSPFPDPPPGHRARLEQRHQEQVRLWNMAHTATCSELGPEVATINRLATLSWILPGLAADRSQGTVGPGEFNELNHVLNALAGGAGSYPGPEFILLHHSELATRLGLRPGRHITLNNGRRVWVHAYPVEGNGRANHFMIQNPVARRFARLSKSAGVLGAGLTIYSVASEENDRVRNDPALTETEKATSVVGAATVEGGLTIVGGWTGAMKGAAIGGTLGSAFPVVGNVAGTLIGGAAGGIAGSAFGNAVGSRVWDVFGRPVTSGAGWVGDRAEDGRGWISDGLESLSSFAKGLRLR